VGTHSGITCSKSVQLTGDRARVFALTSILIAAHILGEVTRMLIGMPNIRALGFVCPTPRLICPSCAQLSMVTPSDRSSVMFSFRQPPINQPSHGFRGRDVFAALVVLGTGYV